MKPTDVLKDEHKGVQVMLDVLEEVCGRVAAGEGFDRGHIGSIIEFLKVFVDKCHHGKEEDHLFPSLEKAGIPREGGPIGVMLLEHTKGRTHIRNMSEAYEESQGRENFHAERFAKNARDYIDLLRSHINKEENILFSLADSHLSETEQQRLVREFERLEEERIGAGTHERFHELLHMLRDFYLKK